MKFGTIDDSGYYVVVLTNNKNRKTLRVHRLVSEAFLENPENKLTVNHKNGIKTDNNVANLEWATSVENNQHAWDQGLRENARKAVKKSISIAQEARKIPIYSKKLNMQFGSCTEAAKYIQSIYFEDIKVGFLKNYIFNLLNKKITKSKFDYGWSYVNK